MGLSRGKKIMVAGFSLLLVWSLSSLICYFFTGGTVITDKEIYIGGYPILFSMILSLFLTAFLPYLVYVWINSSK